MRFHLASPIQTPATSFFRCKLAQYVVICKANGRDTSSQTLKRQSGSQRSRLCLALPACFCVRSRSHAQSVNRNLVFHLIFVVRSQTCSESFVYYNFELCDIRSAEPMHASRKSNHASVQHSGMFICSDSPCVTVKTVKAVK